MSKKLQLLVVLHHLRLVHPFRGVGILRQRMLEAGLAFELAVQHALRSRAVFRRQLVEQDMVRHAVAAVIEAPAVHARQQPAIGVAAAVELGRGGGGLDDLRERRLDEVVGQAGGRIDPPFPVEVGPAGIVVVDDVENDVARLDGLEVLVAEGAGEAPGEGRVLGHRDDETRLFRGCALHDHLSGLQIGFTRTIACHGPGRVVRSARRRPSSLPSHRRGGGTRGAGAVRPAY